MGLVFLEGDWVMRTKWLGILAASVCFSSVSLTVNAAPAGIDDVPLTLSGCVAAGEAKDSFLLTNVEIDGTTLAPAHAFYRFNTTKGLKDHVGHRVEVKGKADLDDVDEGKVKVRTKDGKVTTEVTSERQTVKVEDAWFGSMGSMKMDATVPTYKFEVEKVRRLEGNCASASASH
jgi:hypothetical protein